MRSNIFKTCTYEAGYENQTAFSYHNAFKDRIAILIYILAIALISSKRKGSFKQVVFVNGSEMRFGGLDKESFIYHGRACSTLKDIRQKATLMCCYNRIERLKLILTSVYEYFRYGVDGFQYWLEYCLIYSFLYRKNSANIIMDMHFERCAIWISYIAEEIGATVEIRQHGTLMPLSKDITIPNKVYCTRCCTYNSFEADQFRKFAIKNDACEYVVMPFKSLVQFEKFCKKKPNLIGIISQHSFDADRRLIARLLTIVDNCEIIVMLHPGEKNPNAYISLVSSRVYIEPVRKYINCDVIITSGSTFLYDLQTADYKGHIVYYAPRDYFSFMGSRVHHVDSFEGEEFSTVFGGLLSDKGGC